MAYICCFCGEPIETADRLALSIGLANLWLQQEGADHPTQGLATHSRCFDKVVRSALAPIIPFDAEVFAEQPSTRLP